MSWQILIFTCKTTGWHMRFMTKTARTITTDNRMICTHDGNNKCSRNWSV